MHTAFTEFSFHEEVLEILPDGVLWAKPVKDAKNHIIDFEVHYSNKKADEVIGHHLGSLKGLRIKRDGIPQVTTSEANFHSFLKVYETSEQDEFTYHVHNTGIRVETVRKKFRDGVLSTTRDRKAQREAERNEQEKSRLLNGIIENSLLGILVYEAVRDEAGVIEDFHIKLYNQAVHQLTGISEEERSRITFKELLRIVETPEVLERYIHTVETGHPFSFDFYSPRIRGWLHLSVAKLGDGFLIMLSNITEVKNIQQALQKQSEYLNSIINASLNGIYVLDAVRDTDGQITDFIFTTCNQRYAELTGWSVDQVLGKTFLTLFPHTREAGFLKLCQVIEQNEPVRQEMYYAKAFDRWYDYLAVKLGANSVVVAFQEITKQREAAIQIEQQNILLDNILKQSPSGISVYTALRDQDGKIEDLQCIVTNDASERFSLVSKNERLEKTACSIFPGLKQSPLFQMIISVLETGTPVRTQYYHEQIQTWLELAMASLDEDRLILLITDITETKETQLRLEALVEELRRSNADLEDFAHVASHDLQEPLRKIRTFSDRLKTELTPLLTDEHLGMFVRMESAATRMRTLINDLLTYSQVSMNPDVLEQVELNEVVQHVLQDLEASIHETGATLRVDQLPVVQGNYHQLAQMFQNVLGNALKYRKPGVQPEIAVRCRLLSETDPLIKTLPGGSKERFYLIEVSDNGIGFEQENAQKIFKVFQRLHGRSAYEGTGVGLAIVQKVVANHKGYITALSEPGKGASFRIFLPA